MRKLAIIGLVLAGFLFSGCQALEKKQQAGAAVELNGHYLYRSTLDALTLGLNSEDSARVADRYIRQWAEDLLMQEFGEHRMSSEDRANLERMIEEYKLSLYAQAYAQVLIAHRMPKTVADSTVEAIYTQLADRFKLDESLVRGMLLIVPKGAPKIDKLRGWMAKQEMDAIEKYAYQNASGYELFADKWMTTTELISRIPLERSEMESRLRAKNQVEVADSARIYILQITDKRMRGEAMPIEYARPQIETIVLNGRQVEFLKEERERLYEEALQSEKIKFFD